MRTELVELMLCPVCGADDLSLERAQTELVHYGEREVKEVRAGQVICRGCKQSFPIADYVLSFYDLMPESVKKDGEYWGTFYRWHYEQGYMGYVDSRGGVPHFLPYQVTQVVPQTERERVTRNFTTLVEHPLVSRGGRLLDIGPGSGWTSIYLARRGFDVVAYDPGLENMHTAKEYAMQQGVFLECICAAMGAIRFKPDSFDVVFAYHSLHHVPNLGEQMKSVYDSIKVGGCIAIDEYIQSNPQTNAIAGALLGWAQQSLFLRYRDERQSPFPIPPSTPSVNEDCSGWAIVPAIEKYFHVEMANYHYIFLDRFRELYYLDCDKSPESLIHVQRTIAILYDVMKRASPDGVECVALVGQKRATLPPDNANRYEQVGRKMIYRARTGPRLPLPTKSGQKSLEPTSWWQLPGRVLNILWYEGLAALIREIRSYFIWLRSK